MMHLLFSFNGRTRRRDFWAGCCLAGALYGILLVVASAILRDAIDRHQLVREALADFVFLVGLVLLFWTNLALLTKRFHDRNKSWAWSLISLVPFLGTLWALIEAGCLDGTLGPNRFGPSPKGDGSSEPLNTRKSSLRWPAVKAEHNKSTQA